MKIPNLIILNLTTDCNLRCSYCYASAGEIKSKMPVTCACELLKQATAVNEQINVIFHGGEPLLNIDTITGVIDYANRKLKDTYIEYYIQTNGIEINSDIAAYLAREKIKVSISLDGFDSETNGCRVFPNQTSSFNTILNNIQILKQAGHKLTALGVLMKKNFHSVDKLIDFFVENGMEHFSLNHFISGGRGAINRKLALTNEELFEASRKILEKILYYNKQDENRPVMERNIFYMIKSIKLKRKVFMCMNSSCGAGNSLCGVTPAGDIYPCDDFSNIVHFKLGNIYERSLQEIFEDNVIVKYFSYCSYSNINECRDCDLKTFCGAGCASRKYYYNGDIYTVDPICGFYKLFIPYIIGKISRDEINLNLF